MELLLLAAIIGVGWYVFTYLNPAGTGQTGTGQKPWNPFTVAPTGGAAPGVPTSTPQTGLMSPTGVSYSTITASSASGNSITGIVANGQLYNVNESIPAPDGSTTTIAGLLGSGFTPGDLVDYLNMNSIMGTNIC